MFDLLKKATKIAGEVAKSIGMTAKCGIGWHAGEFKPAKNGPECKYEKDCPDCGEHVVKFKHTYTDWEYVDYSSCKSVRTCIHCGSVEQENRHDYKTVGKDNNCRIISRCCRCGVEQLGREDHRWITMLGKRMCQDCKRVEDK